jgi:acyl-coenzyme A synthetase/AMP-(fatty) acid ligase
VSLHEDEEMALIFTSGTVEKPKGVLHSYKSLAAAMDIISQEISITNTDVLYASQLYFLLMGIMVSAKIYIPKDTNFNPKSFLKILDKYSITSVFLLPFEGERLYKYCSKKKISLPSSLKTILFWFSTCNSGVFISIF